jgi:transcriptional regulator with XRE-family HTH domain
MSDAARADRMRRLRELYGPTQVEFCRRFGFAVSRWANFEAGKPVGQAAAMQLIQKEPDLSLDWIYLGSISGLSVEMARRLGELPREGEGKRTTVPPPRTGKVVKLRRRRSPTTAGKSSASSQ